VTTARSSRARSAPALVLRRRSSLLILVASTLCLVAFAWPLVADRNGALNHGNSNLAHSTDAPWIFVALLPLLLAIVVAEVAEGSIDAKCVALIGVLAACGSAMRIPGGVAGFEPLFFLLIVSGRVLGKGFGFVLGALTLFASALITGGVGPWLPFQMFGAAWVGYFAGCLPAARGRRELWLLAGYGFVAGLAYGLLLDLWFWPFLSATTQSAPVPGASILENLHRFLAFHLATAMGWDLVRALTNAVLTLLVGAPVLAALRRASRRAAFGAPVAFVESPD
jgi:energy-coupling factor transport system substrate-specific component